MSFEVLLLQAKSGNEDAQERLLLMYRPLLLKESLVNGLFDEDLYQEFCLVFIRCVHNFRI